MRVFKCEACHGELDPCILMTRLPPDERPEGCVMVPAANNEWVELIGGIPEE